MVISDCKQSSRTGYFVLIYLFDFLNAYDIFSCQATYEEKEKKYEKELWKGSKDPDRATHKKEYYRKYKELAMAEGQDILYMSI